jgi:hypothetical protein
VDPAHIMAEHIRAPLVFLPALDLCAESTDLIERLLLSA